MATAGIREGELVCSGLSESFAPQHLASEDEQCQVCISSLQIPLRLYSVLFLNQCFYSVYALV